MDDEWVSVSKASDDSGVERHTVRRHARNSKIKARKNKSDSWEIAASEVERLKNKNLDYRHHQSRVANLEDGFRLCCEQYGIDAPDDLDDITIAEFPAAFVLAVTFSHKVGRENARALAKLSRQQVLNTRPRNLGIKNWRKLGLP